MTTVVLNQSPHSEYFFDFGDDAGEAHFILWHHLRHHTYDLLASQKGQTLPPLDLKGKVDADWLYRHSVRHRTHRKLSGTNRSTSVVGLTSINWQKEVERTDWLRIHAQDHANLDSYYGL